MNKTAVQRQLRWLRRGDFVLNAMIIGWILVAFATLDSDSIMFGLGMIITIIILIGSKFYLINWITAIEQRYRDWRYRTYMEMLKSIQEPLSKLASEWIDLVGSGAEPWQVAELVDELTQLRNGIDQQSEQICSWLDSMIQEASPFREKGMPGATILALVVNLLNIKLLGIADASLFQLESDPRLP